MTTSLRPHPRSVGPRVRPGTSQHNSTQSVADFLWYTRKARGFGNQLFLISMRCEVLANYNKIPEAFSHGRRLSGTSKRRLRAGCGHCKMTLENESSVSFSQCLCCGSCDIVMCRWILMWANCLRIVLVPYFAK